MILRGFIGRTSAVRDEDIQAYADGWLEGSKRRQVEQHLECHPEDAERVAAYRRINAGLAGLGRATDSTELPEPLAQMVGDLRDVMIRQRRVRRTIGATIGSVLLLASASGAWILTDATRETVEVATVTEPAGEVMRANVSSEDLAEIKDGTENEVMSWLSKRVDTERFATPDLNSAGFTLSGARVLPTPDGPLVQILYHDDADAPLILSVGVGDIQHSHAGFDGLADRQMAVYWRRGPLVYSLMGPMQYSDVATLTDIIGHQEDGPKVPKAVETAAASSAEPSEKRGVVLVDSKAEASSGSEKSAKDESSSKSDESVKTPSETAEKVEEPKPL